MEPGYVKAQTKFLEKKERQFLQFSNGPALFTEIPLSEKKQHRLPSLPNCI